ncbi:hypothetical protein [Amycolatopsis vastitatis]|uniref:Uncharacterized protein n=1 Tax=Amycolatopsis vastitatis TaxID=1905142 RepID=A0A229SVX9_9PSEU|nr:hypothetical protein [Amycolatopsis vastitatis]OXM63118.1 hypothetical protein CF165_32695 [Amycolatopsis vastitatis]
MLHAIEFGSDIVRPCELEHDDQQRLVLLVRDRKITPGIAGLIRYIGVAEDAQITCVPQPGEIPVPRDDNDRLRPTLAPAKCTGTSTQ